MMPGPFLTYQDSFIVTAPWLVPYPFKQHGNTRMKVIMSVGSKAGVSCSSPLITAHGTLVTLSLGLSLAVGSLLPSFHSLRAKRGERSRRWSETRERGGWGEEATVRREEPNRYDPRLFDKDFMTRGKSRPPSRSTVPHLVLPFACVSLDSDRHSWGGSCSARSSLLATRCMVRGMSETRTERYALR